MLKQTITPYSLIDHNDRLNCYGVNYEKKTECYADIC